jgi:hypothetical protein
LTFPDDFSERSNISIGGDRRAGIPRGVTSSGASPSAIDQPSGETPRGKSWAGREGRPRGQRVLDGLSGAHAGGRVLAAREAFNALSFENEI